MKESYKYEDGNVYIVDYDEENDRIIRKREYQDNILDIIVVENEIEELESNKTSVLEEINLKFKELKEVNRFKIRTAYRTCFIPVILKYTIDFIDLDFGLNIFKDILGNVSLGENNIIVFLLSYTLINYSFKMIGYKFREKEINESLKVLNLDIELLEELIEKRNDKLNELRQTKTKNNENEFSKNNSYKYIDYKEKLESLRNKLLVYNEVTNRYDELLEYYENDKLKDVLLNFNDSEIDLVKEYYKSRVKRK